MECAQVSVSSVYISSTSQLWLQSLRHALFTETLNQQHISKSAVAQRHKLKLLSWFLVYIF